MRKARGAGREDKWRGAVEDREGICWGEKGGLMGGELKRRGAGEEKRGAGRELEGS